MANSVFEKLDKRLEKRIASSTGSRRLYWIVLKGLHENEGFKLFFRNGIADRCIEKTIESASDAEMFIAGIYGGIERCLEDEISKKHRRDIKYEFGFLNYDFDRLCKILNNSKNKRCELASRISGLVFGVYVQRAADVSIKKINKAKLRKFIEESDVNDRYKTEIIKHALLYIRYKKYDTKAFVGNFEDPVVLDKLEKYEGLIAYGLLRKNTKGIRDGKRVIDKLATTISSNALRHIYHDIWAGDEECLAPACLCQFMDEDCANWVKYLEGEGVIE